LLCLAQFSVFTLYHRLTGQRAFGARLQEPACAATGQHRRARRGLVKEISKAGILHRGKRCCRRSSSVYPHCRQTTTVFPAWTAAARYGAVGRCPQKTSLILLYPATPSIQAPCHMAVYCVRYRKFLTPYQISHYPGALTTSQFATIKNCPIFFRKNHRLCIIQSN